VAELEITELLSEARSRMLGLFVDLDADRLIGPEQHHVEPPIWELGHVAWFQEHWLLRRLDGRDPVVARGDSIYDAFNVSYKLRTKHEYPSKQETLNYAATILERCTRRLRGRQPSTEERYFYELVTQHEYMHAENLLAVRQTLGYSAPEVIGGFPSPSPEREYEPHDVEIPGGQYTLGATHDGFALDNERPPVKVVVAPFRIRSTPVTNREYLEFVEHGGYTNRELWDRRGWQWRRREGATQPLFWVAQDNGWGQRKFDRVERLEDWHPVCHINWHEARAYCRWANRRLPTEAEWEMAAAWAPNVRTKPMYPWGNEAPTLEHANLDWSWGDTVDVRALPRGDSASGCRQMLGNVWEWTDSMLEPFPGFEPGPYTEYSQPYFGEKPVLRGGAWVSRSRLVRNSWRNFFIRHRRNIYAGVRTCAP
jgi:iron(II)-dependent oxidoreductase